MKVVGDFEAQILMTELLVRLVSNPGWLPNLFDSNDDLTEQFGDITKDKFECKARTFIFAMNESLGDAAKVWSFGCITAKVLHY
jgi:hypothetical protein